jgi:hypothetical protein
MSYPAKIKAVGINETGGIEVIQNLEVPFPEVKLTDLLVKVTYCVTLSSSQFYTPLRSNGLASILSILMTGSS